MKKKLLSLILLFLLTLQVSGQQQTVTSTISPVTFEETTSITITINGSSINEATWGVTGNALESDRLAFIKAGATSVLTKPVNVNALEKMLESHGLSLAARKTALST